MRYLGKITCNWLQLDFFTLDTGVWMALLFSWFWFINSFNGEVNQMSEQKDIFSKVEHVILRIALILFLLIGVVKLLKIELSSLW